MISTSKPRVRYLDISDVHLGHDRNPTRNIVQNLRTYFSDYKSTSPFAKVDIIFITGDLFDQLVDIGGTAFYEALGFISELIGFCERNRIKLRVLEGTPSHDRQQSRLIESVASVMESKADVKWIKTLMVEKMDDLDLSILYIPDEYTSSAETTFQLVQELFRDLGIDKVDLAQMHGVFKYQMEGIPGNHDTHDEEAYLRIVEHFINIGHHHTKTSYRRIVAQGSFDRLAHGQEEAKGGVLMTIRDDGEDYYEFIENTNAMIFKTIDVRFAELERSIAQVERELSRLPNDSYVRIKASKLHPMFAYIPELRKRFPFLHIEKLSKEEEQEKSQASEQVISVTYNVVEIRPENVIDLIIEEITSQNSTNEIDAKFIASVLEPLI